MPQDFSFPWKTPLWTLYKIQGTAPFRATAPFGAFRFGAVARLKLDVSLADVEADLDALIPRVHDAFPGAFARFVVEEARLRPDVVPLKNSGVQDVQHTLWLLMGTAGFVLLIACANAGNLFLVRAHGRQREVAVRAALGAGRGDLARSFLMESTLLVLLGGMLGLAAAFGGVRALVSVAPSNIPRVSEIGIDGSVLLFTAAISLLTGILFGVIPILRPPPSIVSALKEHGGGSTTGPSRSRARHVLVVGQMSLVLVLLTGAGLMIQSFWHLNRVDPGFDPTNVLTFRTTLSRQRRTQAAAFQHELLARLAGLPGVQSVGAVRCLPLVRYCHVSNTLWVDGSRADPADVAPEVVVNTASAGYFETLRIPLLSGRTFGRADTEQSRSVVVSAAVAATFWPGDDPIGKRVHLGVESEEPSWLTVVGIVGNVQPHQLTEDAESQRTIYTPLRSPEGRSPRLMTFVVRTSVEPLSMTGAVERTVWSLDPRLPVTSVRTMDQVVSETTMPMAFITALLIIAASVALVLGSVGIYGVIAYTVGQRTGEIGLRMALGASAQDVSRMVVGQGLRLVLAGVSIGLAGAFALTRLMRALLFEVSPTDPVTFTSVSVLLLAVALLATYFPARRATLVDPVDALRSQ